MINGAVHNQTTKTEVINGKEKGTTTFTYDVLNRLESIKEPSGKTTSYKYDNMGNRQTETVTDYSMSTATVTTYNYNAKNQLTSVKTVNGNQTLSEETYTYDNYGNMIAKTGSSGTTVNEYDGFNQLVKTVTGNKESTYKYNGEGLRVEKTTGGATTRYLYEYDRIVLETDGSGVQTARNIYGMNLVSRKAGTQTLYYLYNGHADVTALIDSAGNIVVSYYYDPFGNILESTGTVNNPIRYAGYQYDEESGYYYLNARMYDPRITRFLQMDTYKGDVRDPLSLNLYAYCHNEPIIYWDPTGHEEIFLTDWLNEVNISGIEWNAKTKTASIEFSPTGSVRYTADFIVEDGHVSVVVGQNNSYTTYSNVGYVNPNFDKIVLYDGNNMPGWLGSMKRNEPPSKKEWDYYEPFIVGENISDDLKNDILYGENAIPYSVPSAHLIKDLYIYPEKWLAEAKKELESCGDNDNVYREIILKEYEKLVENYRALGIAIEDWNFIKNETYYRFGLEIFKHSGQNSIYVLNNRDVQKVADSISFALAARWSMKLMKISFQNPKSYNGKNKTIKYPTNDPNKETSKTNPYDILKKNKIPQTLTDEEIAAANEVDLQLSLKKIDDKYLKKKGIDAHELKSDFVGNKNISKYDLYVETETGEIFIYQKGAKGQGIATGEYIK